MRNLTAAMVAALEAENVIPVLLVDLDFPSGLVAVHSAVGSITYGSVTYVGLGTLGEVEDIEEGGELQAYGVKMRLKGVPNEVISIALNEECQGRDARIFVAVLNHDMSLVDAPILTFSGRMDNMQILLGATQSEVLLTAENRLADWDRPRIRRYNDADQQSEYPGDLGMQFAEQMVNKTILWGKVSTI